ncbi:MAG: DUF4870 domain-containing protein [Acidobacteria bacterium]|nr:DUF4870 domain-containing protein [Acidobacteriota bacterium]
MAALAHGLQIFCGLLGPLVIFLWKRESRFIAFHCLQAIFWQLLLSVAALLTSLVVVGFVLLGLSSQAGGVEQPTPVLFLALPIIWLFALGGGVLTLVLAIVYAIKAMKGQWAQYPLVGGWAKRAAGV